MSWDRRLIGRAGYYIRLGVNSEDPDDVIVMSSSLLRSRDGGATFETGQGCGDCHDVWIDPQNGDHLALTGDGGLSFSTDRNETRTNVALPIGQMYHVEIDERMPYWVYSNRQDNGAMRGPISSPELPVVPAAGRARPRGKDADHDDDEVDPDRTSSSGCGRAR